MAVTVSQLQQLYLAYFGRPADFDGIQYYTTGDWDIWQVARAFSASPESRALYGTVFSDSVIDAIYDNLFGRDAEPAGLLYWSHQVSSGALTTGEVALGILLGAQNDDAVAVANKLAVAETFTAHVDTLDEIKAYAGDKAAGIVRTFMDGVTFEGDTVPEAIAKIDALIASLMGTTTGTTGGGGAIGGGGSGGSGSGGGGGGTGPTPAAAFAFTTGIDTLAATNATNVDTATGLIDDDGTTNNNTFSDGDSVAGNGHTVVNVNIRNTVVSAPVVALTDIDQLNLASELGNVASFDASSWRNVSNITLSGAGGAYAQVDNLANDDSLRLAIDADTAGTIYIDQSSSARVGDVQLYGAINNGIADATGAMLSAGSAGLDLLLGQSDEGALIYVQAVIGATAEAVTLGDFAIGHVNITAGTGADAGSVGFGVFASTSGAASEVGDMDLGTFSIGASESAHVEVWGGATANTGSGAAASATVHDFTSTAVDIGSDADAEVEVTLGNKATAHMGGNASAGGASLGPVSLSGEGAASFSFTNSAIAMTAGNTGVGDVSVGAIALYGTGAAQDHTLSVSNAALSDIGDALAGDLTVGGITIAGSNYQELFLGNTAVSAVSGTAASGTLKTGDIAMTLSAADASSTSGGEIQVILRNQGADKSGGIQVGDITVGTEGVTAASALTGAMNAVLRYSAEANAAVTLGNITVTGGADGAVLASTDNLGDMSQWLVNEGKATSVTIGNVDYSGYEGAAVIDVSAYSGGGVIKGGQSTNTITDNAGTNTIDLSASDGNADKLYLLNSQTAVSDTGTAGKGGGTLTAALGAIDMIAGWDGADSLRLWDDAGNTWDAIDGDHEVVNDALGAYADFLANAETQVTQVNKSAYAAVIGGNTYVALNNGGTVGQVVGFNGAYTFDWVAGSLRTASVPGITMALTTGVDTIAPSVPAAADTVTGVIDDDGTTNDNTFSTGDAIAGNGYTTVEVTVDSAAGASPAVSMSDIRKIDFVNAGATTIDLDGSAWRNVSEIALSGAAGATLTLNDLQNDYSATFAIDAASAGIIHLGYDRANNVKVAGGTVAGTIENRATADNVGATATFGAGGIDVALGASDVANVAYDFAAFGGLGVPVSIGDLTIDHIDLDVGAGGNSTIVADLFAEGDGAESRVGDLHVGRVTVNAAPNAFARTIVFADAYTDLGPASATTGNATFDAVEVRAATGARAFALMSNSAYANKGGMLDVGDLTLAGASLSGDGLAYLTSINRATALEWGSATVGDVQIGAVEIHGASLTQVDQAYFWNTAKTDIGAATVGDINVDSLDVEGRGKVEILNSASVSTTGAAVTGSLSVGAINVNTAGASATSNITIKAYNVATAGTGDMATVDSLGIDSITATNVAGGNLMIDVSNEASGGAGSSAGNLSVGNLDIVGGDLNLRINNAAAGGAIGDTTIGDISLGSVTTNAAVATIRADADSAGDMTLGNIKLACDDAGWHDLWVGQYAAEGTAGLLKTGDIQIDFGDGPAGAQTANGWAISIANYGKQGSGGIEVGDIAVTSSITATSALTSPVVVNMFVMDVSGDVNVGDITVIGGVQGATLANTDILGDMGLWLELLGNATIGNVDYSGYQGATTIDVSAYAGAGTIKGGSSTNTIVDNTGRNIIDLSASAAKVDSVYLQNSVVIDTGTSGTGGGTVMVDQAAIDVILGGTVGDRVAMWDDGGSSPDSIDGNGTVIVSAHNSFAEFLAAAELALTRDNWSALVAVVDGTTYAAFSNNHKVGAIVEIVGTHTFTCDAGALVFAS